MDARERAAKRAADLGAKLRKIKAASAEAASKGRAAIDRQGAAGVAEAATEADKVAALLTRMGPLARERLARLSLKALRRIESVVAGEEKARALVAGKSHLRDIHFSRSVLVRQVAEFLKAGHRERTSRAVAKQRASEREAARRALERHQEWLERTTDPVMKRVLAHAVQAYSAPRPDPWSTDRLVSLIRGWMAQHGGISAWQESVIRRYDLKPNKKRARYRDVAAHLIASVDGVPKQWRDYREAAYYIERAAGLRTVRNSG